jgi:hypothetical protein
MVKGFICLGLALIATTAMAGEEVLRMNAAKAAFRNEYLPAKGSKAFAQAPDGTWGWAADRTSPRIAAEDAVTKCTESLKPKQKPCVIVHVDNWWTEG